MGRSEGLGCYCAVNHNLREVVDSISKNYRYVVIDNEAGMEHLSRRTTAKIDLLLLVSEPSPVGIMSAARIRDLAREMEIAVARTGLVINRVPDGMAERLIAEARGRDLEVLGTVPADELVMEYALSHKPAMRLPADTPAVRAIEKILSTVVL
jgi:CO dehydrogenase maturation factor